MVRPMLNLMQERENSIDQRKPGGTRDIESLRKDILIWSRIVWHIPKRNSIGSPSSPGSSRGKT